MGQRYLVVVDMQHDFVDGALGTPEAQAIVASVAAKAQAFDGTVVFTKDTHYNDYLQTLEGKNLPAEHCLHGTPGWELMPELQAIRDERNSFVFEKATFASLDLAMWLAEENVARTHRVHRAYRLVHRHLRGQQCASHQGLDSRGPAQGGRVALRRRHARQPQGGTRHPAQLPGGGH